jgi:predicted dehydrogenase
MSDARSNRRDFMKSAAVVTVGTALSPSWSRAAATAPSKKFIIGMMGTGGRGTWLLQHELARRPEVEIAYLCDPDAGRLAKAADIVREMTGKRPTTVGDFRTILDDKDVNAFFNVTPDHWHALPTILACQAGKDVYVEKPASHTPWEGRKMVEAARKYDRVVQLGAQTRSAPELASAIEFLRSGKIGDPHLVRVYNMLFRPPVPPRPDGPVPEGVDYDTWLGPAPARPFNPLHFHYTWHWFWDYSGGDIINQAVHQIDAGRALLGKSYPKAVSCTAGKLARKDAQETPDTQIVTWEYDGLMMVFELTLWTPHMVKIAWDLRDTDAFPDWRFDAMKVEVHGTGGMMLFEIVGGGWQAWDPDHKQIAHCPGRHPHTRHIDNFFECIATRKRPNGDIEEGHRSTLLCQIGNIAHRVGNRRLAFDGPTETFRDAPDANALLKRTYREPWVVPEHV